MSNSNSSYNFGNYKYLAIDLNGTLTLDGKLLDGVAERLHKLGDRYQIFLLTADMHGNGKSISDDFNMTFVPIEPNNETFSKGEFIKNLGSGDVVSIGAGSNDSLMLKLSALGIAVIGPEGLSGLALNAADIVVPSILVALDLLLFPNRLTGTLRG